MKKKIYFLGMILIAMSSLTSCKFWNQIKYYKVYLQVNDLNGIKEGDLIENQSNTIGYVKSFEADSDSSFVVILSVTNDFQIPKNSQIRIVSDLDNTSSYVNILMSHSKRNYSTGDTIISHGTVLMNKNIQLNEIKVDIDSLPEGIRALMN